MLKTGTYGKQSVSYLGPKNLEFHTARNKKHYM